MRLRQKLFAAILAAMVILFLLLALVSFMHGLEAERTRRELEARFDEVAVRRFREAAGSDAGDRWSRLCNELQDLGFAPFWQVEESGRSVLGYADDSVRAAGELVEVAREGECALFRSRRAADLRPVRWLSGLFWAVAAGTAFLLLVVYGLLLRLVLRPVENLVAASRVLSKGTRPGKVPGEVRTDEMGELIGAFNRMAEEVCQSREDLQRRVEDATREYEKAQRRLVLEQRLAATGRLAAGVAHEINNPLGGMMNAARSLSEGEDALSERGREYLALIGEGLERIGRIVERMRAFVKPRPAVGPVELGAAVKNALAFVRHRIDKEGVKLLVEVDTELPSEPVTVTGDAGELQQVFLNLILNALDAVGDAERREITLRLDAQPESAPAEAVVTVADTGCGMDAEQLAGAFDLFYSTKGEGGTGLGLAIAHKIVTDHGGAIELESSVESGKSGTTVRVRLPLAARGDDDRGNDT